VAANTRIQRVPAAGCVSADRYWQPLGGRIGKEEIGKVAAPEAVAIHQEGEFTVPLCHRFAGTMSVRTIHN
jgi:hypothetical protein